jgi:L,D-transpeptidase catalytic domain
MVLGLSMFFCAAVVLRAETSVEIDLQEQRAYLLRDGRPVLASPISSGRYGHLTETGSFKVIEKERNHYSSIYGKIVDAFGHTVVADADVDMKVPRLQICSSPDALLYAVPRLRWNACRIFAGLCGVTWLCSNARTVCNCVLQLGQRGHSGHRVWQNTDWPLSRAIAIPVHARWQ